MLDRLKLHNEVSNLINEIKDCIIVEKGYALQADRLSDIEIWTSDEELKERLDIFKNYKWFPIESFECEDCNTKNLFSDSTFQWGFQFDPDDSDRLRILCEKCLGI